MLMQVNGCETQKHDCPSELLFSVSVRIEYDRLTRFYSGMPRGDFFGNLSSAEDWKVFSAWRKNKRNGSFWEVDLLGVSVATQLKEESLEQMVHGRSDIDTYQMRFRLYPPSLLTFSSLLTVPNSFLRKFIFSTKNLDG